MLAAAGIGSPTNRLLSTVSTCTLKRASRSAPQTRNRNAATQPSRPNGLRAQEYMRRAGVTPKATRSARESNSTPNLLVVPVMRATLPSRPSQTAEINIQIAAVSVVAVQGGNHAVKTGKKACGSNQIGQNVDAPLHVFFLFALPHLLFHHS